MKKITKIMMVLVLVSLVVALKNPIVLGAMDVVDYVGYTFDINVVNTIDALNSIYYFSVKNELVLAAMNVVDFFGNITKINVVDAIDFLNELYYL